MCVAAIAWEAHPRWSLVAIANRDEVHARASAPLERWADGSGIIAGRDLEAGGTWLGVSERGEFALLTNFRDPVGFRPGRPSRGRIVQQLLCGLEPEATGAMNPFNAFQARPGQARFLSNYPEIGTLALGPGVHGVSNGPFERPWPKTLQLCDGLERWLGRDTANLEPLFAALRAETPVPSSDMPDEGPMPAYAPVFISNSHYGTRCSTIVAIDREGQGTMVERSFAAGGEPAGEVVIRFSWPLHPRNDRQLRGQPPISIPS